MLQKLLFPNGLIIDTKKREYLIKDYNSFFELVNCLSGNFVENKNGLSGCKTKKSASVAGVRLELTTFGL